METRDKIGLMIEEYKALRSEILQSISERFRILSFGVTAVAVLMAFGGGLFTSIQERMIKEAVERALPAQISSGSDSVLVQLPMAVAKAQRLRMWDDIRPWILLVVVPFLCVLLYVSWASEVHRGRRASQYLWGLERRINKSADGIVLNWEERIRLRKGKPGGLFREHYGVTGTALGLLASVSLYFGLRVLGVPVVASIISAVVVVVLWRREILKRDRYFDIFDMQDPEWPESLDPEARNRWPRSTQGS